MKRYINASEAIPYEVSFIVHSVDKSQGYDMYTVNYTNGAGWKKRTYDAVTLPKKYYDWIRQAKVTEHTEDEYELYEVFE